MKKISSILLLIIGVTALTSCQGYNNMVEKQEAVTAQWGNVQNAYQRRADLIPNLVNTVKGYATHEQETFTQVTEAKSHTDYHQPGKPHCRKPAGLSTGTESTEPGTGATVADSGKLSRAEGESKFPRVTGRAGRYGKSHFRGTQ